MIRSDSGGYEAGTATRIKPCLPRSPQVGVVQLDQLIPMDFIQNIRKELEIKGFGYRSIVDERRVREIALRDGSKVANFKVNGNKYDNKAMSHEDQVHLKTHRHHVNINIL